MNTEERDRFLEHVRRMVEYWAAMHKGGQIPAEDAIEGVAFSLLVALDGGAAVGPYHVIPVDGTVADDIAGCLHELLHEKKGAQSCILRTHKSTVARTTMGGH